MSTGDLPPLPPPHTRVGVGGVLIRSGRVLVNRAVYRERFTLPGGFVDAGETLDSALLREFEEETGVRIVVGRLLLVRHEVEDPAQSGLYFGFEVRHVAGEPSARPPEIAESRELPVEEALRDAAISELSRLAIRLAVGPDPGWPRSAWTPSAGPPRTLEVYHGSTPDRGSPGPGQSEGRADRGKSAAGGI